METWESGWVRDGNMGVRVGQGRDGNMGVRVGEGEGWKHGSQGG